MGLDPRHLSIQFHPKRKLQKTSTQEAKLELTSCRTTSWRDQQTMTGRWKWALNNIDRTFQIKYQKHPKHASRYPKSLKSCESASFFWWYLRIPKSPGFGVMDQTSVAVKHLPKPNKISNHNKFIKKKDPYCFPSIIPVG